MKKYILLLTAIGLLFSCRKRYDAPVPGMQWDLFDQGLSINNAARKKMEGVYSITTGNGQFGNLSAFKWSYTVNGTDTVYHASIFCQNEVTYFICEGRRSDSNILLNGYWRKMINTETGRARLTIAKTGGGAQILSLSQNAPDSIIITGSYGNGEELPAIPVSFKYLRPLNHATPLEIVAHRAGGRSSDLLPASENSVEMVKLASRFGATGIEIDVRMTSDHVPVIFHDATLNERLIQKNGMIGPIENYSYTQLYNLVRLPRGEHIPTLREMLSTFVYNTPLHFVWLDTKFNGPLQQVRDLQVEFMQRAAAIGRNVEINIGIPDKDVLHNFEQLPNYQNVPSVCELDPPFVAEVNARVWGPRWTLGTQNAEVANIHAQGRKAFVWTLDVPENIEQFLRDGNFDGILSNYPSAVAYYYYVKQ